MPALARPPIPVVVMQHAQESAALRHVRSVLLRAPHVRLHQLQRLDERIAAHLDGLAIAGTYGAAQCAAALERPGAGEVFASAVCAIEARDAASLARLIALAGALPQAWRGLLSAFGWVSAAQLKGIASPLLAATDPLRQALGLGVCRLHHADPGALLPAALGAADAALRTEALRCTAVLGRTALRPLVLAALGADAPDVRFHAALAACALGERGEALAALVELAFSDTPHAGPALTASLQAAPFAQAQALVQRLARLGRDTPARMRRLVRACGLLGDAQYVPWLIDLMRDDTLAQLAGESFSMITGADLAALDLERKPPEGIEPGPNDDPGDADVALDEDDSLPWPEPAKVQRWWQAQAAQMPAGTRLFVGAPAAPEQFTRVLREGFQRQRNAAARMLCLARPGVPMFNTGAPAWRQQRRVAAVAA